MTVGTDGAETDQEDAKLALGRLYGNWFHGGLELYQVEEIVY